MPFKTLLEKNFIGRDQEIEALYNISSEAKKGIATSIFLSGQYGVGKTELLRQLFQLLFWKQHEVVPFFYTVNSAFLSAHDFSMDFLNKFIHQWLAFQKKDTSLINANWLSIEGLRQIAEKLDSCPAVDIIENFLRTKALGDPTKVFLSAINTPTYSYSLTGIPVIVIIDDFQKSKKFYRVNSEENKNLWMLFEEAIKNKQIPYILTGSQAELHEMFFQKTSLGESLELLDLLGINKNTSLRLFISCCESYGIEAGEELLFPFIDLFNGNPFYIKNFVQKLRNENKNPSKDDLWTLYFNEITSGKFHTCWASRLKKYIPRLELRKVSLEILYHLCKRSVPTTLSDLTSIFSISTKDLNALLNIFQTAGIIETNFSTFGLIEDRVLSSVIKGLYYKEILEKPVDKIEEVLIQEVKTEYKHAKTAEVPLFEVKIPIIPKAELIAVNALEQIAKIQNISTEIVGQLQIALIDLFNSVIWKEDIYNTETLHLKFEPREDTFTIEIKIPYHELVTTGACDIEKQLTRRYTDEIKLERTKGGTRIILVKNLKKDLASRP